MRTLFDDSVAVITGASSGIGRATAHAFAERRGTVVLAARREHALQTVKHECFDRGGRALVVPTDVTNHEQIEALARTAIEHCGRIDHWVNNAAVTLFARFEEAPLEDYERVLQTNLLGYVYGARAAIARFRKQGRGTLINVGSLVGVAAQPYTSAYGISKWGIRALGESLRMELMDAPDINVCTLLPATVDTPLFDNAANFTGRAVQPMEPIYPADQVANTILELTEHPRREVTIGSVGTLASIQHALAPDLAERTMARQVEDKHLAQVPGPDTHGNLFEPKADNAAVSGGWLQPEERQGGMPTKAMLAGAALIALPLTAWAFNAARERGRLARLTA